MLAGRGVAAALCGGNAGPAEERGSRMDGLGLNLPGLITQFVNFGLLLALLWIFLHRPLRRVLDERRARIEAGLHASQQAAEQAQEARAEAEAAVQRGREDGQALVARAQEIAERIQREARGAAQQQAEQLLARARQDIQQERDHAIQQLRDEVADLTIAAAGRVVGQALDRTAHQRLIDEVLQASAFGRGPRN